MNKRQEILNVALDLFSAKGYDGVGIQEIVQKAGVTKPSLYYYFGSKRGILETLFEDQLNPFISVLADACNYTGDLPLSLQRIIRAYFTFATENPVIFRMQISMWYSFPESEAYQTVMPYLLKQHQLMETVFMKAVENHGNMQGRHQTYASTLSGIIYAYSSQYQHIGQPLDEQAIQLAVQQFSYGIYS